jgi:hypothetical protein
MELSRTMLGDCASFDDKGFDLHSRPLPSQTKAHQAEAEDQEDCLASALHDIPLGRYELPRRSGDAHLYRIHHPLAQWITQQAKTRLLEPAQLVFDYEGYGSKVSTLEPYRGKAGWLTCKLLSVKALGHQEEHLLVAAATTDGHLLAEDDPQKLLRLPAQSRSLPSASGAGAEDGVQGVEDVLPATLSADVQSRSTELLRGIHQRNLGYFDQEAQKLDAWADDLKLGLERDIKEIDREIKEVRRTAATSPTLNEKLSWQKRQRELEAKRSKLRRELFIRQDEVEAQRNDLISQLEVQLQQQVDARTLFTTEWELT